MQHSMTGLKEQTGASAVSLEDKIKGLNKDFDVKFARAIIAHGSEEVNNILRHTYESDDDKKSEIEDKIGLLDRLDATVSFVGNPYIYFHTKDDGSRCVVVDTNLLISKVDEWNSAFDVQSISAFNCVDGKKITATYTDDALAQPEPISLAHVEKIARNAKALIKQFYCDNGLDINEFDEQTQ